MSGDGLTCTYRPFRDAECGRPVERVVSVSRPDGPSRRAVGSYILCEQHRLKILAMLEPGVETSEVTAAEWVVQEVMGS